MVLWSHFIPIRARREKVCEKSDFGQPASSPSVPEPIIHVRQGFVDAVFGLGHNCLLSRCQSPQCRSRHERQVSSRGIDRGTPTRPLALSDDLVSPIVVRVCCCHRRASQEAPVFCRNPASAMRFTAAKKEKASPRGLGVGSIQSPKRSPATLRWLGFSAAPAKRLMPPKELSLHLWPGALRSTLLFN